MHDFVVLGAGISGLACARRLARGGADVVVLDRADKPGGRCATRWHEGQPFDYGPLFLHGSDPEFLRAMTEAVPVGRLEGWPRRVAGHGMPCQPKAFAPHETRLAVAGGLTLVPQALSQGLQIRLRTLVTGLRVQADGITVETESGGTVTCRAAAVCLALEQSLARVDGIGAETASAVAVLRMFTSLPCLAVVAGYAAGRAVMPDWDVLYPDDNAAVMVVGNETSKRAEKAGGGLTLVIQASPRWSHRNLERPKEEWSKALLAETARVLGPWAGAPDWTHEHRWRYGRLDLANELAAPLVIPVGKHRLGVAGDLFAPGGGAQAAWISGDRLGQMLSTP